jgi:hypothetical protein
MKKRQLDQFDLEAEREGSAIRNHRGIPESAYGKGITKQRRMHKRGQEILTTRVVKKGKWLV